MGDIIFFVSYIDKVGNGPYIAQFKANSKEEAKEIISKIENMLYIVSVSGGHHIDGQGNTLE